MSIHKSLAHASPEIKKVSDVLQRHFPRLDIWYVKEYTSDQSSNEASITIDRKSGHIGIGVKKDTDEKAKHVPMKIYNIENDKPIFFFDKRRLQSIRVAINDHEKYVFEITNPDDLDSYLESNPIVQKINLIETSDII